MSDTKYNGRVNLFEPDTDTNQLFKLYDRMPVNEPASFRDATKGIWTPSTLSTAFFSLANMQIIQNGIRAGVYRKSNSQYIIPSQNTDTLKIIMRSIFLQHSSNGAENITGQIQELNKMVLDYAIPQVYGSAISYNKYLRDASTLVQPLEMPKLTYTSKQLPRINFGFRKED